MVLPSPNYVSQHYLELCSQNQKLVNFHTIHRSAPTTNFNQLWNSTKTPPVQEFSVPLTNLSNLQPSITQDDPEDIHITGVDILKEWIDISELPTSSNQKTGRENHVSSNIQHVFNSQPPGSVRLQTKPEQVFNFQRLRSPTPEIAAQRNLRNIQKTHFFRAPEAQICVPTINQANLRSSLKGLPHMFNIRRFENPVPRFVQERDAGAKISTPTTTNSGGKEGQRQVFSVQRPTVFVTPRVLEVTANNQTRKAIFIVRQRLENPEAAKTCTSITNQRPEEIEISDDETVCEEVASEVSQNKLPTRETRAATNLAEEMETVIHSEPENVEGTLETKIEIGKEGIEGVYDGIPPKARDTQFESHASPIPPEKLETSNPDNWADLNVVEDTTLIEKPQNDFFKRKKKYKCEHCPYKTKWKNNMTKHVICRHQSLDEINWFECAHCFYKGKTREHLRAHLRTNHEQFFTWYQCKHCSAKYRNRETLRHHVIVKHTPEDAVKWFKCDKCDYKSRNKRNFNVHVMLKHTEKKDIVWFQCHSCDYQGKTKVSLRRHVKNMHTGADKTVWHSCYRCGIRMTKVKAFNLHERECRATKKREETHESPTV